MLSVIKAVAHLHVSTAIRILSTVLHMHQGLLSGEDLTAPHACHVWTKLVARLEIALTVVLGVLTVLTADG